MGKSSKIPVGFWYKMSAHIVACHKAHAVTRIKLGDKIGWSGNVTTSQEIGIYEPMLFGGEQREGGFMGYIDVVMGGGAEQVNEYLEWVLPESDPMPAFRHVTALVLKDCYVAANNPNIRPINIEVFFQPSKDWYVGTERPGGIGINPAHLIRECILNPVWGLGYSQGDIDDDSFRAVALKLYQEGFGINMVWDTDSSLYDFVSTIAEHIDGIIYLNPYTGKFVLRLMRKDYTIADIPHFDESNVVSLDSYERLSMGELVNQVVLIWYDNITDNKRSVTVHNPVVRELQGGIVPSHVEFPGIGNVRLAMKVANRELKKYSTSYSRLTIKTGRLGATLAVGDVFAFSWVEYGLVEVVYRIAKVSMDTNGSTEVTIVAVEDVYSFGESIYEDPQPTLWEDPIHQPMPALRHQITEMPYIVVNRSVNDSQTLLGEIDPVAGFVTYQATAPSKDAFSYSLFTRTGGASFASRSIAAVFTPTAIILQPMKPEVTSVVSISPETSLTPVSLGTYALIEGEIVSVVALSSTSMTINRGVLDTVPVEHASGVIVWFADQLQGIDTTEWAAGVRVDAKATPLTGKGTLALELAPVDSLIIKSRWQLPYPPGNVKVNGERWPTDTIVGEPVFTWSHRDRTTQLTDYIAQDVGNIGPEPGVTYTVRVYDRAGVLKRTVTGITGTTWTYASADETTDLPGPLFLVTITSVRDGLESWQAQQVLVFREGIGYGYNYGNFYGGWTLEIGYGYDYGQHYGRLYN